MSKFSLLVRETTGSFAPWAATAKAAVSALRSAATLLGMSTAIGVAFVVDENNNKRLRFVNLGSPVAGIEIRIFFERNFLKKINEVTAYGCEKIEKEGLRINRLSTVVVNEFDRLTRFDVNISRHGYIFKKDGVFFVEEETIKKAIEKSIAQKFTHPIEAACIEKVHVSATLGVDGKPPIRISRKVYFVEATSKPALQQE